MSQSKKSMSRFIECFSELKDPRMNRRKAHPLINVIVIALCAVICGERGWLGMAEFGRAVAGDLIELSERHSRYGLRLSYSGFGLSRVVRERDWPFNYIWERYDRWKEFLADPDISFEALVKTTDWKKLRQLLDDVLAYPAKTNESYAAFQLTFQMVFKYMDLNFHDAEFDKLIDDYLRRPKPFSRDNDPMPGVFAKHWFSRQVNREKLDLLSQAMAEPGPFENAFSRYVFVGAVERYSSGFQELNQIHREENPEKRTEKLHTFRCERALSELALHNKK